MTRAADPRIGTDLGSYRIEAVIGRGGMGVVYRAEQLGLARKVALKILAPVLVDDEAFRQRFVRESQMAAAIDHPNILPIYEAGEVDGVYFLAMRFVDGADLETRLRSGPLEPPQAVRLLGQVASALDAAGEAGLVHRDVKPANILIASSRGIEKADHAYLSDFGLTKHRGSQTGLTQTGAFMGTLDYVAPEQVEGRPVDSRTDQYSLACVAFHCLTGVTPFPRDTDIAIAMAHLHDPPPSASAVRPELPTDVDAVLAKGMAKRPDDRYPTSEAFALALREALGVRVSEPHPIPVTSSSGSRRLAVTVGLGLVAIVAVGVIGFALVGRGSLSPGASPSADVGHSGAFPGAAEAALLARLPSTARGDCMRGSYAAQPNFEQANSSAISAPEPDASVICTLPTGADAGALYLQVYPATSAGDAFVRGRIDEVADQIEAALPGDCANKDEARGRWSSGDIVCYQAPQYPRAWIYWTDPSINLLGAVSREDLDSRGLYVWWQGAADAIHRGASGTVAGSPRASRTEEPFPTELESSLTLSLPKASVRDCARGDAGLLTTQQGPSIKPRAHVVCQMVGGNGPDVVDAWLLPQLTDMRGSDIIAALALASGIEQGECATDDARVSDWFIPDTEIYGRVLCRPGIDGADAELDWSVDDPAVVYRAVEQGGDHAGLYDWWLANREAIEPMTVGGPDPRVGTDLGPYRIEAVIGRGGMGVVYRAEERRLKRRVALKILPPALADDLDYRARFERESQMAAAIDDPNILPIYEAGEVEGVLFIAMRYVDGTDLEARLRDGPLEPRQVVHLLGQVASALDAAHARGLVHRDVKPGNVLIAAASGDERGDHAYLTDFGLTKLRTQDTSLTRVGTIMGTLDSMAPEQLEGRDIDGSADQYALAAIAFRALTGRQPFERDSEAALITAILRDPPPSASVVRSDLPAPVDAVLARGLAKAPGDRFASCAALVAELRSALGVTSTAVVGTPPAVRMDRRRSAAAIGALAVVLVLVVSVGFVLGGGTRPGGRGSPSVGAGLSASANPDPSAYPNTDEAALIALLPLEIGERCRRGSYDSVFAVSGASARPLASLACTLPGGGVGESGTADRLEARKLRDSTLVTADRVVARAGADHGVPDGDCATDLPGVGNWSIGEAIVGQAACWIEGADAVVEWSHDRDGLVFRVARANRDEGGVVGLWQQTGLAAWTAIREANGGVDPDAYPNAIEQGVLDLMPADLRELCQRGDSSPLSTENGNTEILPIASLTCDLPPGSGADTLDVRRLRSSANFTPESVIGFEARARGIKPGDCATSGHSHGRWSVGEDEVGAIVCYREQNGTAVLSWTKTDQDLYVRAIRDDGDQQRLYAWFASNARFIGP